MRVYKYTSRLKKFGILTQWLTDGLSRWSYGLPVWYGFMLVFPGDLRYEISLGYTERRPTLGGMYYS